MARYCSIYVLESQLRQFPPRFQLPQRKRISLVSTQVYWLLPDFHFKFKPSFKRKKKRKKKGTKPNMRATLCPPAPIHFPSHHLLPACLMTPDQVSRPPQYPENSFPDMVQHSSCFFKKGLQLQPQLQTMFPHRSK